MFIDLNDKQCQDKEDKMFEHKILDNYTINAKYEQDNINTVATNQNT